jgi:hypothetical protein
VYKPLTLNYFAEVFISSQQNSLIIVGQLKHFVVSYPCAELRNMPHLMTILAQFLHNLTIDVLIGYKLQ